MSARVWCDRQSNRTINRTSVRSVERDGRRLSPLTKPAEDKQSGSVWRLGTRAGTLPQRSETNGVMRSRTREKNKKLRIKK